MLRLGPLLLLLASQVAGAGEMYRWVSKDGEVHYTDDPSTIPKGVKAVPTTGDDLGSIEAPPRPPGAPPAPSRPRTVPAPGLAGPLARAIALGKEGRCPLAFEAIEEAAGLAATDVDRRAIASTCGKIALERLQAAAPDDAARFVRRGRELDSDEPTLSLARGEIALAEGDQPRAIEEWQKGLRVNPGDGRLRKRLDELEARAGAFGGLGVTTSKWVTVSFDGASDTAMAAFVVKTIEDARAGINEFYGYTGEQRVEVILYPAHTYDAVSPTHPAWSTGLYDGRIHLATGGAAKFRARFANTLLHEYGHRVLARIVGAKSKNPAPAWLNEGMAQLAPTQGAVPTVACALGHSFPLRSLEGSFSTAGGDHFNRYLEAQHAVEWVRKKYGQPVLKDTLKRMGEGATFDDAFERAVGTPFAKFAEAFDKKDAEH